MKRVTQILGIGLLALIMACEGPSGPPGPPGPPGFDGQDGINILGQVFEIQGTFSPANNYSLFFDFPLTTEVFESDLVLVYILWEQFDDGSGELLDVWRLLPQVRILNQGLLQYNYDHTFVDVSLFLESDFDLGTLLPGDTDNQIFRIAVVPADFAASARMDVSNMEAVMKSLDVEEHDIQRIILD